MLPEFLYGFHVLEFEKLIRPLNTKKHVKLQCKVQFWNFKAQDYLETKKIEMEKIQQEMPKLDLRQIEEADRQKQTREP